MQPLRDEMYMETHLPCSNFLKSRPQNNHQGYYFFSKANTYVETILEEICKNIVSDSLYV